MHLIELLLQRHRDKTVLAVLVLAALSLLAMPETSQLDVSRRLLNAFFLPVDRTMSVIENYRAVESENRRLKRMVATLMLQRERVDQFRLEHERLRRLAAFKEQQFYDLLPCEVIGRNLDRFQTVLVVDKGSADSLAVGQPVVTYQGYVGRVVQVFSNSAWVQLAASRDHPVSTIDKRSRVVGILEWRRRNLFELTSVSAVEDVAPGDTLLTSGFGGRVPKGFPVAIVSQVRPDNDGLSLRVEANSPVPFMSLEEVFVLRDEISWDEALFYDEADTLLLRSVLEER